MTTILVLHGPNLNLLGQREPGVYGSQTLDEINQFLQDYADQHGIALRTLQSNHEGALIDTLHDAGEWANGVVFNPGAYTHTSYALRDAITAVGLPESIKISWQLPNYPIIAGYELFRRLSGDTFPSSPQMTTGITNSYVDEGLTASQPYEYTVRSVDLAGNLHQLSNVVTAAPREIKGKIHLPAVIKAP